MWIERGDLRHFRNYEALHLEYVPNKNIFIGKNGAGKTNILEAIYLISHGKSHRARHERELIQMGCSSASVKLETKSHYHATSVLLEAKLTLSPEGRLKTTFRLNENPVKSRSEIVGKIPTVTFFLSDLLMLRGTPEERRNALDRALVQYDSGHFSSINSYNRIRQQKGQILKQSAWSSDFDLLDSLNHQLATAGAEVMFSRIEYLKQIESLAKSSYYELSQGEEYLELSYQPSFTDRYPLTPEEKEWGSFDLPTLRQALWEAIVATRSEEQRREQVLIGPHRDDIRFSLNGKDACLYGSQGQQRTTVLAFKFAEIALLKQKLNNEMPLLLLDDVMAELDPVRQHQLLLNFDSKMQLLLTTTHLHSELEWFLKGDDSARIFPVVKGNIVAAEENNEERRGGSLCSPDSHSERRGGPLCPPDSHSERSEESHTHEEVY